MKKTLHYLLFLFCFALLNIAAYSDNTGPWHPSDQNNSNLFTAAYFSNLYVNLPATPTAVPICSGQTATLGGLAIMPAPISYTWQIYNGTIWVNAPGTYNKQNYITSSLTNTTGADLVDHIQRLITPAVGNGAPYYDSPYDVTVSPITPISKNTVAAATVAFCTNGDPQLTGSTPAGSNGTFTYQWQNSADGTAGSFTDISGATTQNYDPGLISVTTYYRRAVASNSCVVLSTSNSVKITIQQAIANNAITAPVSVTFCVQGHPGTINGFAPKGGNGTFTYQWQTSTDQVNYTDISGATGVNYTPPALMATTSYQRVVKTGGGCSIPSVSNTITITVYPEVTNNMLSLPATASFCTQGDAQPITGSTPTGGNNIYTYQWQSSTNKTKWTDITTDGTGINYNPPLLMTTTYYRRAVTSGVCMPPIISKPVAIIILPAVSNYNISLNPDPIICGNGSIASIIGQTPQGGDGTYAYQWQNSGDGITFTDIVKATGKDLPPSQVSGTTYYQRQVTSGACSTANVSNIIMVKVQPAIANNVITPPGTVQYCINANAATLIGSTPTGGDGTTYNYQWQSSTDNITFTDVNGENRQNYNRPTILTTMYYRRIVKSGACTIGDLSAIVTITVYQQVAGNMITAPAVTDFCVTGTPGSITGATPTQGDLTATYAYQWQSSITGFANSFQNIQGENGQNFTFNQALKTTTYYRRVVTSGVCNIAVASNQVEIIIDLPITNNTFFQGIGKNFCTYTVPPTITGSLPGGGNGVFSYQWQISTDDINFSDINSSDGMKIDLNPPLIKQTTYFRRKVTSGACIDVPAIAAEFTVSSPPAQPMLTAVAPICAGGFVNIAVVSAQADLTYNWYDSPSSNTPVHTGITYQTDPLSTTITYYLVASNTYGCASPAATALVTVYPTPVAPALMNANASACYSNSIILSVANPQSTSTYKWYKNVTGGASFFTGPGYAVAGVVADLDFYVEETNGSGCISASRAHQHVMATSALQIIANGQDGVCPGTSATIAATATDPDAIIHWYLTKTGGNSIGTGSPFPTPVVTASTTFWAEAVSSVNGCISPTRVPATVSVLTPLVAPFVTVTDVTSSSITFSWDTVSGAASYQVSIDGGTTFTNSSSGGDGLTNLITGLKPDQSITLIVKAIGSSACQLSVESGPVIGTTTNPIADQLYVANAFTPNGDGNNDIVYVHNERIKSMKFYVYDQWGELLYTSFNQQNGWDGTFKGKKEPVGVYVYYVEAVLTDGKQVKKKGMITLLR